VVQKTISHKGKKITRFKCIK